MIISRLSGGLGNQMFQYAIGRACAYEKQTELLLDTSSFTHDTTGGPMRTYVLDKFTIYGRIATASDYTTLGIPNIGTQDVYTKIHRKIYRLLEKYLPISKRRYIIEKTFTFDSTISSIKDNSILIGVWQSEKYFKDIENIIRNDFTLAQPLSFPAQQIAEQITSSKDRALSIHIRRGDYVSNPTTQAKHGTCSVEYYKTALSYIQKVCEKNIIYVFSDDIQWVIDTIQFPDSTVYVSSLHIPEYEELMLMSMCHNNIIANSSFSWWGAWLNQHPDKIVIAPKQWFVSGIDTSDLLPTSWITL